MQIKVILNDGSEKIFDNVPEGVTPEQAKERAFKEFGGNIKSIEKVAQIGPVPQSATPVNPINNPNNLEEIKAVIAQSARGALAIPEVVFAGAKAIPQPKATPETLAQIDKIFSKPKMGKGMAAVFDKLSHPLNTIKKATHIDRPLPTTNAGKFLGSVGEGAVAAVTGPGGLIQPKRNLAIGGMAGISGETASRFVEGEEGSAGKGLARVGGSLLGGGLTAIGSSLIPNPKTMIKQATSHITKEDWAKAKELEKTLNNSNIAHLKSQLLGPSSTMDDLVETAAAHPQVKPLLISAVKDAPEDVRRAFTTWMDGNLTITANDSRRQLLQDIQEAASRTDKAIVNSANSAYTQALPDGVSEELYSPKFVNQMRLEMMRLSRNPHYFGPKTDSGRGIRKFLRESFPRVQRDKSGKPQPIPKGYINNALKDLNKTAGEEGYTGIAQEKLKGIISKYTDDDFGAARSAKQSVIENNLNPFRKGIAGDIANMGGGVRPDKLTATDSAITRTFPKDKQQVPDILQLGKDLGDDAVSTLFREHLTKNMENALSAQISQSASLKGPFNLKKSLFGTDAQKKNTEAALQVIGKGAGVNPKALYIGYTKLMDAFDSFKDLKIPSSVNKGTLERQAGQNAIGVALTPNVSLRRKLEDIVTKKAYTQIAEMVMSPDGLRKIAQIAKSPDPKVAQVLARSIIADIQVEE